VLIILNVAMFLAQTLADRFAPDVAGRIMELGLLQPNNLTWWTLLSYAFLHAGFMHIFGNMLFLWVFGTAVEDKLGRVGFAALYIAGAVAAGGLHAMFQDNPVLGASGAVAAVTGAFLVFFPRVDIKVLLFFLIIGVYSIPAWFFIVFAIAKDFLFAGLGMGGVAYLAHIGGYLLGFTAAMTLLASGIVAREGYDLFSIATRAKRRRDFLESGHIKDQAVRAAEAATVVVDDELATARAEISRLAAAGQPDQAARAWVEFKSRYSQAATGTTTMGRKTQLDIANILLQAGDHTQAADAYERFAEVYPSDPEAARVRVMLALIATRYLQQRERARAALAGIRGKLTDPDQHALALQLKEELNAA